MAREYKAMSRLKPLKVEIMIPKLMAVIGAIAEKENLGNEIVLDLGVLLPYGELESRQELIRSLSKSLKGFYFRDKKITVKLEGLNVIPEASGVASFSSIVDRNEFKKNLPVNIVEERTLFSPPPFFKTAFCSVSKSGCPSLKNRTFSYLFFLHTAITAKKIGEP